ncbi:MAG: hypothetical protein ACRC7G_10295 [Beijerinckiaceae bacterium]
MSEPSIDISDILARKSEGRRSLQTLSMAEKILRMEALRNRLSPFKAMREGRKSASSEDAPGSAQRPKDEILDR